MESLIYVIRTQLNITIYKYTFIENCETLNTFAKILKH